MEQIVREMATVGRVSSRLNNKAWKAVSAHWHFSPLRVKLHLPLSRLSSSSFGVGLRRVSDSRSAAKYEKPLKTIGSKSRKVSLRRTQVSEHIFYLFGGKSEVVDIWVRICQSFWKTVINSPCCSSVRRTTPSSSRRGPRRDSSRARLRCGSARHQMKRAGMCMVVRISDLSLRSRSSKSHGLSERRRLLYGKRGERDITKGESKRERKIRRAGRAARWRFRN